MSLKHSYTLLSPFYDAALTAATRAQRARSLAALPQAPARVLLSGVGTGLDLPLLPKQHRYTGIDLTHAMLRRALPRGRQLDFCCVQGDAQRLPFADHSFRQPDLTDFAKYRVAESSGGWSVGRECR